MQANTEVRLYFFLNAKSYNLVENTDILIFTIQFFSHHQKLR